MERYWIETVDNRLLDQHFFCAFNLIGCSMKDTLKIVGYASPMETDYVNIASFEIRDLALTVYDLFRTHIRRGNRYIKMETLIFESGEFLRKEPHA